MLYMNFKGACKKGDLNSLGGWPIVPKGFKWPQCAICSTKLAHVLQFDILSAMDTSFLPGSHFNFFHCPKCKKRDVDFIDFNRGQALPNNYWELYTHYRLLFYGPSAERIALEEDKWLVNSNIEFSNSTLTDLSKFNPDKVGGEPDWNYSDDFYTCSCGKPMKFLFQLFDWEATLRNGDRLVPFHGNQPYFFVCAENHHQEAVLVIGGD